MGTQRIILVANVGRSEIQYFLVPLRLSSFRATRVPPSILYSIKNFVVSAKPRNSQRHKPHSLPLVSASPAQRARLLSLYFQLKIVESANPTTVSATNPDISR